MIRRFTWFFAGVLLTVAALSAGAVEYVRTTGLDGRSQPGRIEADAARVVRSLAVPAEVSARRNPVAATPDVLQEGMEHFADHCASCHANDGSGDTTLNRGLYPRAPDMRLRPTQQMPDGELFYVIEHGIRFTGMPGWSTGTAAGEQSTWHLVHFIRHLPQLSASELERMQQLNPRSPDEVRQEIEEERFLNGNQGAQ